MSELEVRIVRLAPMRVASAYGFGESPEEEAWDKLLAWAREKGLLDDLQAVRFFGFNNPNPSPGSPNYGYEQWITVGAEMEAEGEIQIKDIEGGLYAVTRCTLNGIGKAWNELARWREDSSYKSACHQWLEEGLTPPVGAPQDWDEVILDLYLPIAE